MNDRRHICASDGSSTVLDGIRGRLAGAGGRLRPDSHAIEPLPSAIRTRTFVVATATASAAP